MREQHSTSPVPRAEPVVGEVIEPGPRTARPSEASLLALHRMLAGIATIAIALPTVLLVLAVVIPAIVLWIVVSFVLHAIFALLAMLVGARPASVAPAGLHRAQWSGAFARMRGTRVQPP